MLSLAILGSGKGSNAQSIMDAIDAGKLNARIVCVLSDVPDAFILERARSRGIPAEYVDCTPFKTKLDGAAEQKAIGLLKQYGADFIARAQAETGIVLDIISAEEEARLAVLGCHILLEQGEGPAMIFDIGGGSTELVLVENQHGTIPRIHDWQSVPWGVVSLTETCGAEPLDEAGRAARYAHMRQLVRDSLAPFAERISERSYSSTAAW